MFLLQEKLLESEIPTTFNKDFNGIFNFNFYDGSIRNSGALKLDSVLDYVSSSSTTYEVMRTEESTVSIFDCFPKKTIVRCPLLCEILF